MKALFWVSALPFNGDLLHYRNAVSKHLIPQAKTLAKRIDDISFVLPAQMKDLADHLPSDIKVINLPLEFSNASINASDDSYVELYREPKGEFAKLEARRIKSLLPDDIDVVLLWETPADFLNLIYPDALIINQMPGVFSREPYPHTVTFDPVGLYRTGTLHNFAEEIQRGLHLFEAEHQITRDFTVKIKEIMRLFQHVAAPVLENVGIFDEVALLPLQTSGHYAFKADAEYINQLDFTWDVLDTIPSNTGLLVTQYQSALISEKPIDSIVADAISVEYENFIYNPEIDKIPSVSQLLLQHVDRVVTASSSLGLQGMVWHNKLSVKGDTFLERYATDWSGILDVSWSERCDNTVCTLINRLNPLASDVVHDENFLFNLLKEMLARKNEGMKGLGLLPSFQDIDSGYQARLMNAFREERVSRYFSVEMSNSEETKYIKIFSDLISDETTKVISFDVFDTLIRRPYEKPSDLWKFFEAEALALSNGVTVDFSRTRGLCEVQTRKKLLDEKIEITIDDIYETVAEFYGVPVESLEPVKQREIEREIEAIRTRPFGKRLFELARQTGKPIYLISDMYLSQSTVESMVENAGYRDQYIELFLSSTIGKRKHSGELFDYVLNNINVAGKQLVHVGDNKKTDIQSAEKRGIRAFRWSSSIDWLRSNSVYSEIYPPREGHGEKARSVLAGTTAFGLFDGPTSHASRKSFSGGDPARLGYGVLGPLCVGYMTWLIREARRDGISDLYFMAREGWVFKEVFDVLAKGIPDVPKTHYLLGSRRAIRLASCRTAEDVLALGSEPYTAGVTVSDFIEGRFGISLTSNDIDSLREIGVKSLEQKVSREWDDRLLIGAAIKVLSNKILENAKKERANYSSYLREEGFYSSSKPGIVDIGWKANIQGALGNLTNRRTVGYYYATLPGAEVWEVKGDIHRAYSGLSHQFHTPTTPVSFRHLVEFLTCHSSRSFIAMDMVEGNLVPLYRKENAYRERSKLIKSIHTGVIQFSLDFYDGFSNELEQIVIPPSVAEAALKSFVNKPTIEDAKVLVGQAFEDVVGGVEKNYIIVPSGKQPESQSVWRQGHRVVYSMKKAKPKSVKPKEKTQVEKHHFPEEKERMPMIEKYLVRMFVSERKFDKYQRSRYEFFNDTKNPIIRIYATLAVKI